MSALKAERLSEKWTVVDPRRGRWWPSDAAQHEIAVAADPAEEAVRMCTERPSRGEWDR